MLGTDKMNQALTELWQNPDEKVSGKMSSAAKRAVDKAKTLIEKSQLSLDQIGVKTVPEKYGIVRDILEEGHKGLYDAIILGRRATYTFQWFFERPADEIAKAMVKDTGLSTPLWICPEPCKDRKNILVCVDGSENGYRVVDHAGYILSDQVQHNITVFHLEKGATGKGKEIFPKAIEILTQHGIARERIQTKTSWGLSVANTVLSEANKNGYGAVAIGLHGMRDRNSQDKFLGETAAKIVSKIEKTSIWCVP